MPSVHPLLHLSQISYLLFEGSHINLEPTSLDEAKVNPDWPQWRDTLKTEYASLRKH